jgi:hypothetical protein
MTTKTDNSNLDAKLELRRHFLKAYPGEQLVLDCCAGEEIVWNILEDEFILEGGSWIEEYFPVDLKVKKGRLKIDSIRLLGAPGLYANVVDIDTYGSPWRHWRALLPNVTHPMTVFLTIGHVQIGGGGGMDSVMRQVLGLTFNRKVPVSLLGKIMDRGVLPCLAMALDHGLKIVEAQMIEPPGHAKYVGVRLEPTKETA